MARSLDANLLAAFRNTGVLTFTLDPVADATAGAIYSNNGSQFTVQGTITGGNTLLCMRTAGTAHPEQSGTLTKVSGSGDAEIDFTSRTIGDFKIYWYATIYKNTNDDWGVGINQHVFGNIRASSIADATVYNSSLINIGNLDISADVLSSPMAKVGDVSINIENLSGTIDPRIYNGRVMQIRAGYGATMTAATSEIFYTGKVYDFGLDREKFTLKCRGKGELRNKEIGNVQKEDVLKKYRGKIMPITHGDWTDEDAYMPFIINKDYRNLPEAVFGDYALKQIDALWLYDPEGKIAYRAITDDYSASVDNTKVQFWTDSGSTVSETCIAMQDPIKITHREYIVYETGDGGGEPPPPCVIRIDNEYMLLYSDPGTGTGDIKVDRGWGGTIKAQHNATTKIYKVSDDWSRMLVRIQHTFWPVGISGNHRIQESPINGKWFTYKKLFGYFGSINNEGIAAGKLVIQRFENTAYYNQCAYAFIGFDLIFPKIGISGPVSKMYVLAACRVRCGCNSALHLPLGNQYNQVWVSLNLGRNISNQDDIIAQYTRYDGKARIISSASDGVLTLLEYFGAGPGEGYAEGPRSTSYNNISYLAEINLNGDESDLDMANGKYHDDPGAGGTTEYVVDMTLDDIGNLNSNRYSIISLFSCLSSQISTTPYSMGWADTEIYGVGFRIEFLVDPVKHDFFARGKGRTCPGSYHCAGSAGDLMEKPTIIIEDILRREVALSGSGDLDSVSIGAADALRLDWKFASTIYDKAVKMRDLIKSFCEQARLVYYENYAGKICFQVMDNPVGEPTRTITDAEILHSKGKAYWDYDIVPSSNLITSIKIRYKKIIPEDEDFAGLLYCSRYTGSGAVDTNFASDGQTWATRLNDAYEIIQEERPLIIDAPYIRDSYTVEELAKNIIKWKHCNLFILNIDCTYSVADIEIGDKITVSSGVMPSELAFKTWLVQGIRQYPNVAGQKAKISLELIEMPLGDLEGSPVEYDYHEVFISDGEDFAEVFTAGTGDDFAEVLEH